MFELVHFPLELVVELLEAARNVVVEHLDVVEAQVLELLRLVLLLLYSLLQKRVQESTDKIKRVFIISIQP